MYTYRNNTFCFPDIFPQLLFRWDWETRRRKQRAWTDFISEIAKCDSTCVCVCTTSIVSLSLASATWVHGCVFFFYYILYRGKEHQQVDTDSVHLQCEVIRWGFHNSLILVVNYCPCFAERSAGIRSVCAATGESNILMEVNERNSRALTVQTGKSGRRWYSTGDLVLELSCFIYKQESQRELSELPGRDTRVRQCSPGEKCRKMVNSDSDDSH